MSGSFSKRWSGLTENMLFLPSAALLLILVADFFLIPGFFSIEFKSGHLYGNVIDILVHGSPTMVLAIGMTLVIATGGVDLSVGAVMAISASVAAIMMNPTIVGMNLADPRLFINDPQYTWAPLWLVVVVPLIIATLCGLWNGVLVSYGRIQPMVATLVLMLAGRGIAQLITIAIQIVIFYDTYAFIGNGFVILPFSLYIALGLFLVAWLLTRRTAIGLMVESVGINFRSSFYSGINEKRVKLFAYAFSIGLYTELDAILAVVIGGTVLGTGGRFSLMGSAIGALVLQTTITSMLSFGVPASAIIAVKALVVIAVVLLYDEQVKTFIRRLGTMSLLRKESAQ